MAVAGSLAEDVFASRALPVTQPGDPIFGQPSVRLAMGGNVQLQYGADTSRANLPSGAVRYRRFALDKNGQDVKISVRVIADKHDGRPRFTVFSPQLVILDEDGQIRRIVPLDHLQLDIRPFRATRLRECVVVNNLHGFLLASDPGRLGQLYQFTARRTVTGHPDHGFYRASSPMKVFLTYSDAGPVEVEVTRAPRQGSACRAIPD
ncbi:MAG: hypothetical protein WBW92_10655 [Rhodanobacteraceae bacterium]